MPLTESKAMVLGWMSIQSSPGLPELWVPYLTVTDSADFEHVHLCISKGLNSILTGFSLLLPRDWFGETPPPPPPAKGGPLNDYSLASNPRQRAAWSWALGSQSTALTHECWFQGPQEESKRSLGFQGLLSSWSTSIEMWSPISFSQSKPQDPCLG